MNLYLDLETIPCSRPGLLAEIRATIQPPGNISKPETIAKWMAENAETEAMEKWKKTALDGTLGEVVVIGFAVDDAAPSAAFRPSVKASEGDVLQHFFDEVIRCYPELATEPFRLVGHNVIGFDLRFLYQRAVILGVKPSFPLPFDQRYNGDLLFDTMLGWAGWGNRVKLSALCGALGIPVQQNGVDGSMVWDLFSAGRFDDVILHCTEDVVAVREVYKRMTWEA